MNSHLPVRNSMPTAGCFMANLALGKINALPRRTRHFRLKMTHSSAINPLRKVESSAADASDVVDVVSTAGKEESSYISRFSSVKFGRASIVVIGLSIRTAPTGMKEKLALPQAEWPRAISELCSLNHVEEAAVLTAGDLIEVYLVALSVNSGVREVTAWMSKTSGIPVEEICDHRFLLYNDDAVQHLLDCSVGLKSVAFLEQVVNNCEGVVGFGRTLRALFKHTILYSKGVGDVDESRGATIPAEYAAWSDSLGTVSTMRKLRGYGERIRAAELDKCLGKLGGDVPMDTRRAMEDLSRGIVSRLLHRPMQHLKSDGENSLHSRESIEDVNALNRMFGNLFL